MIKKMMLFLTVITMFAGGQALAKDFTLAWDANTEPDVAGYRIYYKNSSSALPYDGTGASQGASPIDVGANLTTTLTGLAEGETYYFAVTAYDAQGLESTFSNIVASGWVPNLLAPAADETVAPNKVMFSWNAAPAGTDVTYTLYYGANPTLKPMLASSSFQSPPLLAGAAFMGLFGLLLAPRRRMKAALLIALLAVPLFLGACGGGGGGGDPAPAGGDASVVTPDGSRSTVQMIAGLKDTYYTATDLKPATKYYWKVVATDAGGKTYESVSGSFTTESF